MKNNGDIVKKGGGILFGLLTLFALWIFSPMSSRSADDDMSQIVSHIEREIKMPEGAHSLAMYDRYYARGEAGEMKSVFGVFRYNPDNKGRVRIISYDALPKIFDGGCNIVRIRYLISQRVFDYVACNGEA